MPGISSAFLSALDETAKITKADIFLLKAKQIDDAASLNGSIEITGSEKLRLVVFGDMLTAENAKIRLLILIDQMVSFIDYHTVYANMTRSTIFKSIISPSISHSTR